MISICMAYKNRRKQLIQTLYSISQTKCEDYEIIIVDDASSEDHQIIDLAHKNDKIKLIIVKPEIKNWVNPVVAYNAAFREAKGDKIIIQNPECAHVGDVIDYVDKNLKDDNYISFSCLSLPHVLTSKYIDNNFFKKEDISEIKNIASGMGQPARFDGDLGWYNHPNYLPRALHFCNAITAKDLNNVGGFDERFAQGYNYDDNDFANRVMTKVRYLNFVLDPFVVHLHHYMDQSTDLDPNKQNLVNHNLNIFNKIQSGEIPMWDKKLNENV